MFTANHSRFATYGVIAHLPGEIIDSIWMIIDENLQGVVPLGNLLRFDLLNNGGKLTVAFSEKNSPTSMAVDLPFPYSGDFPKRVLAYDDGDNQTILLPEEGHGN
ncbi:DUF960 domain-containing protein [Lacticaseibacillus baoqingensis]|uniref:DUF960 domain-containing protein n=1 Tax=Lacticaseibacillus baoqingensis TaxID=2486013 RepID=A0ABW4E491_9LACO|nr:DUF960 domain-containing protein [Lacticaseibacillus baoqingensis]